MGKLEYIYSRLPIKFRDIAATSYGYYWKWLRFGVHYQKFVKEYMYREAFSLSDWETFQKNRFKDLVKTAVNNVPYYKNSWSSEIKEFAKNGNYEKLPLLEKEPIRNNPYNFINSKSRKKLYPFFTSGSTGTPVKSLWTRSEIKNAIALREARSNKWAGVSFLLPRATFSGRMVVPKGRTNNKFHVYNHAEKQVYFSAFHLSQKNISYYINALEKYDIKWMTGYAVSLYLMARIAKENCINIPKMEAIITTSEKLTSHMKSFMEDVYDCRVYQEYSTVETAIFASECENGKMHISPDVSIVEILRPDGTPCEPGEIGEIVTTPLLNNSQILIRYRIGDLGAWEKEGCTCGRKMPVLKEVTGRVEDVVIGPDGRKMVRFHGIFVDQPNLKEGQIVQKEIDHILVRVVPTENFSHTDIADIKNRVIERLGRVNVQVETVDDIPRNESGKFQPVISYLNKNRNNNIHTTGIE